MAVYDGAEMQKAINEFQNSRTKITTAMNALNGISFGKMEGEAKDKIAKNIAAEKEQLKEMLKKIEASIAALQNKQNTLK